MQVVVRGPHMIIRGPPSYDGIDTSEPWITRITKEVFRGLESRVVFLQPWDMTVAVQNPKTHPPAFVNQAIVDVMLSYLKYF